MINEAFPLVQLLGDDVPQARWPVVSCDKPDLRLYATAAPGVDVGEIRAVGVVTLGAAAVARAGQIVAGLKNLVAEAAESVKATPEEEQAIAEAEAKLAPVKVELDRAFERVSKARQQHESAIAAGHDPRPHRAELDAAETELDDVSAWHETVSRQRDGVVSEAAAALAERRAQVRREQWADATQAVAARRAALKSHVAEVLADLAGELLELGELEKVVGRAPVAPPRADHFNLYFLADPLPDADDDTEGPAPAAEYLSSWSAEFAARRAMQSADTGGRAGLLFIMKNDGLRPEDAPPEARVAELRVSKEDARDARRQSPFEVWVSSRLAGSGVAYGSAKRLGGFGTEQEARRAASTADAGEYGGEMTVCRGQGGPDRSTVIFRRQVSSKPERPQPLKIATA
jgi:multidrug efflux pump subunit AcrA (membrane-fusion protein)